MGNVQSHAHIEQARLVFERFPLSWKGRGRSKALPGAGFGSIVLLTLLSMAFHFTAISILAIVASCMFEVPS
jgi:hypothetical protein